MFWLGFFVGGIIGVFCTVLATASGRNKDEE